MNDTQKLKRRICRLEKCLGDIYGEIYSQHRDLFSTGSEDTNEAKLLRRLRARIERTIDPWSTNLGKRVVL